MMNSALFSCLAEERSICRRFGTFKRFRSHEAFAAPHLSQFAHWNLAYPIEANASLSEAERSEIIGYYRSMGTVGHILSSDSMLKEPAVESTEYFVFTGGSEQPCSGNLIQLENKKEEVERFSRLVQECAHFVPNEFNYFNLKMHILASSDLNRFFVLCVDGEITAFCSLFRGDGGSDFLFNVGVLPKFEGQGFAKELIYQTSNLAARPLYTYSSARKMRESLLPSLGWASLGETYVVPLK